MSELAIDSGQSLSSWMNQELRTKLSLPPEPKKRFRSSPFSGESVVFVRVSEDLHKACLDRARAGGLSLTEWVIDVLGFELS